MGKEDKSVTAVVARYASSRFFEDLLKLITAFLRPKLLSPEHFGLWTLFKVIPNYARHAQLGSLPAMRYLIPYYAGKERHEKVTHLQETGLFSSLGLNCLLGVCLLALALKEGFSAEVKAGFFTMACAVVLQSYQNHYIALLKARQEFPVLTSSMYVRATSSLLLSLPLLYFFRIYGVYVSLIMSYVVAIAYFRWKCPLPVRARFRYDVFRHLIGKGFPIMLTGLSIALISTSDRLVVSYFLGTEELGYYGIAVMMFAFLKQVPGTAREVLEPRLMRSLERGSEETNVNEYLLKPMINTAYLMPFLIGPVFFVFPIFVSLLLPRYILGIEPTQILSLGVYFLAMTYAPQTMIVASNWQTQALLLIPPVLVANVLLSILLVKQGFGLSGVAASSSISFLLLSVALLGFLSRRLTEKGKEWRRHLVGLALPFPVMIFFLWALSASLPRLLSNDYVTAAVCVLLWWAIMFLLHRWASHRFLLLQDLMPRSRFGGQG